MSKLTQKERDKLSKSDFALPDSREYPIQDKNHAEMALSMVSQHGTPEQKRKVRKAVHQKYPDIQITGVMQKRERQRQKQAANDGDGRDTESKAEDAAES